VLLNQSAFGNDNWTDMTDLQIVHMEDNGELFSFNDLIGDATD
jgi:hypothetical protein